MRKREARTWTRGTWRATLAIRRSAGSADFCQRRGAVQTGAPIYSMAAAPDGRSVVCAGPDGTISFWSVDGLDKIRTWKSAVGVLSVAISPDGKLLAAGGEKGSLQLWDIAAGTV